MRFLASLSISDMNTVVGKSMAKIAALCKKSDNILQLSAKDVKQNIKFADVPDDEEWRIAVVKDMISSFR